VSAAVRPPTDAPTPSVHNVAERDVRSDDDPVDLPDRRQVLVRTAVAFAVLASMLLLLGLIGRVLAFDGIVGDLEVDATRWIADRRTDMLDAVARIGSSLSDTFTVIGAAVGAVSMLWASGHARHASALLIALALELSVFLTVSTVVGRDRPDVTPLGSVPSTSSFPSGHVAAALVLYGGLVLIAALLTRSRTVALIGAVPATIAVAWVAAARVYEGVHHPTDVLGGLLLGAGALVAAGVATGLVGRPLVEERRR
jgi:membrane-associated phospholipid phosphatase